MSETRRPTELHLESIAAGDVDPAVFGLDARDARIVALRESNAEILARHPARSVALHVKERLAGARRQQAQRLAIVLAPAAACALLLVVARPAEPLIAEARDVTVVKGLLPDVHIYALLDGKVQRVEQGTPGERVQLGLTGVGDAHVVLISVDGRGNVTRHFPRDAHGPTQLAGADVLGETRLPDSFELDDAPDFERFVLVTSASAIDVAAVERAARALGVDQRRSGALRLEGAVRQTSRLLLKTTKGTP